MMKYTPRVLSEIAPMASASSPETAIASGHATHALVAPSTIITEAV